MEATTANTLPATPIDPRAFRNTMGRFATGITIITAHQHGETHGMTANGFLSVSLDPPLILVSIGHRARMHQILQQHDWYGVSLLTHEQQALSQHFAGRPVEGLEIPFVWQGQQPLIAGALAHIAARIVQRIPAGDHTLYLAEVTYLEHQDAAPLLFYAGHYHQLTARPAPVADLKLFDESFCQAPAIMSMIG